MFNFLKRSGQTHQGNSFSVLKLSFTGCLAVGAMLSLGAAVTLCGSAQGQDSGDELQREASWDFPSADTVQADLEYWIGEREMSDDQRESVLAVWEEGASDAQDMLARFTAAVAEADERVLALQNVCQSGQPSGAPPSFPWLSDGATKPVVRQNMRLAYGRWLAQNAFYDEAQEQLRGIDPREVVDPATLLFYRGVVSHRLLDKSTCLQDLSRLMEKETEIPARYATVARLMEADIRPLEEDSLDEISRLMEDIERRLRLGRAGKRVRKEESDVIAKLDKIIEEIEKQQSGQQQAAGGADSIQSSSPAQDSLPLGGRGAGDVDQKSIGDASGWGNLPPKEREEALQQISKELPAHFREVIEEYFRKLAKEE